MSGNCKAVYYDQRRGFYYGRNRYRCDEGDGFAAESLLAANTRELKRGDVVILNDGYPKYKGELQIVLKDMPNDGRKNVTGHLPGYKHILLDYSEPWKLFAFTRIK